MLTKMVDGKEITLSATEEATTLAEWADNVSKPIPSKVRAVDQIIKDPEQLAALKEALGK